MTASVATMDDLDFTVDVLRRRREALVPHAPVFWLPAPDADARHRAYLHHLLTEGGARAWRTSTSVLVAARRGAGWLVDDFRAETASDAIDLWNAFASTCEGDGLRFVVPTYEKARAAHAVAAPAVYAPPGPMLFLRSVTDGAALPAVVERAPALGCAGVVVSQRPDDAFAPALTGLGFHRHCDFFEGVVRAIDDGARSR